MSVRETDVTNDAATVEALHQRLHSLEQALETLERRVPEDRVAIVVFSGDLDKLLAGFVIATGAAALGQEVTMFFTFWGLSALKQQPTLSGKTWSEKMMSLMTPGSTKDMGVSKLNFFGIGARMLRSMMNDKQVASVEELMEMARDMGVRFVACEMSRDVMGIGEGELMADVDSGGVAAFLGDALNARTTLFI